ncbi:MAG TPA: hypothetical protein VF902_04345 [Coriobacteriia bacterium]
MRKTSVVLLALLAGLAVLGLSGCTLFSSPLDRANTAIEDGNAHIRKYQASEEKVSGIATELNSLNATTAADASKALDLVGQLTGELAVQKTELAAAADAIAQVQSLDVDEAFKKYGELEVAALGAQSAVVAEGEKYYAEMSRHYTAIRDGKSDQALTAEILKNIDTLSQRIAELSKTASDAKSAADTQFGIVSAK